MIENNIVHKDCFCNSCMLEKVKSGMYRMVSPNKYEIRENYKKSRGKDIAGLNFLYDPKWKEFYAPGQVMNIYKYIPEQAECFIVAGPAAGNEAQVLSQDFKNIKKIIGFEPSKEAYEFQIKKDFPGELYDFALSSTNKTLKFYGNGINTGNSIEANDDDVESYDVQAITMDSFIESNPEIDNIVLWADIEGSEYDMLLGFEKYLDRVLCMNLELLEDPDNRDGYIKKVDDLLIDRGFSLAYKWNLGRPQANGEFLRGDYIYVKK